MDEISKIAKSLKRSGFETLELSFDKCVIGYSVHDSDMTFEIKVVSQNFSVTCRSFFYYDSSEKAEFLFLESDWKKVVEKIKNRI
jgi:hypothetical protein